MYETTSGFDKMSLQQKKFFFITYKLKANILRNDFQIKKKMDSLTTIIPVNTLIANCNYFPDVLITVKSA